MVALDSSDYGAVPQTSTFYDAGRKAFRDGLRIVDNPTILHPWIAFLFGGRDVHRAWEYGWLDELAATLRERG